MHGYLNNVRFIENIGVLLQLLFSICNASIIFMQGADQNNAASLSGLGFLSLSGYDSNTPQNVTEAARYFQLAADQNNPEAQYYIGALYLRGEGVPKDYDKAMKYLQLASSQGQVQRYISRISRIYESESES